MCPVSLLTSKPKCCKGGSAPPRPARSVTPGTTIPVGRPHRSSPSSKRSSGVSSCPTTCRTSMPLQNANALRWLRARNTYRQHRPSRSRLQVAHRFRSSRRHWGATWPPGSRTTAMRLPGSRHCPRRHRHEFLQALLWPPRRCQGAFGRRCRPCHGQPHLLMRQRLRPLLRPLLRQRLQLKTHRSFKARSRREEPCTS